MVNIKMGISKKSLNVAMGKRLRAIRKEKGEKSKDLGADVFSKPVSISKYETGELAIPHVVIVQICEYYQLSYRWLYTGAGDPYLLDQVPAEISDTLRNVVSLFSRYPDQSQDDIKAFLLELAKVLK